MSSLTYLRGLLICWGHLLRNSYFSVIRLLLLRIDIVIILQLCERIIPLWLELLCRISLLKLFFCLIRTHRKLLPDTILGSQFWLEHSHLLRLYLLEWRDVNHHVLIIANLSKLLCRVLLLELWPLLLSCGIHACINNVLNRYRRMSSTILLGRLRASSPRIGVFSSS